MNRRRGHEPDATVVMFGVVPGEKGLGPGARLNQAAEALGNSADTSRS